MLGYIFFSTNVLPFSKYSLASLLSHCRAVSCENDLLILVNSASATRGHSLASWTGWKEFRGLERPRRPSGSGVGGSLVASVSSQWLLNGGNSSIAQQLLKEGFPHLKQRKELLWTPPKVRHFGCASHIHRGPLHQLHQVCKKPGKLLPLPVNCPLFE